MIGGSLGAGRESIQRLNFVSEPVFHEVVECAVRHGWLTLRTTFRQPVQYIVGSQSAVVRGENLKDAAADRRQAQPLRLGAGIRPGQHVCCAGTVIMMAKCDGWGWQAKS